MPPYQPPQDDTGTGLTTPVSSRVVSPEDRPLRFVIETAEPIDLTGSAKIAMNKLDDVVGPVLGVGVDRVEPLFPGAADRSDQTYKLANFYLMILPISLRQVLLQHCKQGAGSLYDLAYQLREAGRFVDVEPDLPAEFYMTRPLQEYIPGCMVGKDDAPADINWAYALVRLHQIPEPKPTGAGILIGHLDTGHTLHPELNFDVAFDANADRDVIDNDDNARDPMPDGSSHGTCTASLITSAHGTLCMDDEGETHPGIMGVAPESRIVSVRAIERVVAIFNTDIASGVWHCIQKGVHVITMSLGGYANPWLECVIAHAVYEQNMIVTAAAGNCWPWVVYPAAYPEVIACGGVGLAPTKTMDEIRVWKGSAQGSAVDISAPAENVYVAGFNDNGDAIVLPGEGTSFASPYVAGVAALWLQRHGRHNLIQRYAGSHASLADVYRWIIKKTAQVPDGWDASKNGAGILDAQAVLAEPLPAPTEFHRDWQEWKRISDLEVLYNMFDGNEKAREGLEELIAEGKVDLEEFLRECGREFTRILAESKDAWKRFSELVEAKVEDVAEEVEDAVEKVVDVVVNIASDFISKAAGWLFK